MLQLFSRLNWSKVGWIVAIEVGIIITVASFFLPGGEDLHVFYLPFAHGCLECGFIPYFARWFIWPLALIPPQLAWPIWTAITVAGFIGLSKFTKVNPGLVLLSFPAMGQFWLGQIDVIIGLGLTLSLLASNPYLRGLGVLLAMIKPQIAGLAILVLLIHQPRQEIGKVLLIPFLAMILSFIVFGLTWPAEWLANSLANLPVHIWRMASLDIWPYGMGFILLIFAFTPLQPRFKATLMISTLATPFFGVYSYVLLLLFYAPWWSLPLSYSWLLFYPIWGNEAMRIAWILPVSLLGYMFYKERTNKIASPQLIYKDIRDT